MRSGTTWSQQAYLKASNAGYQIPGAAFGRAVAVSGDAVVVGALLESSNATGVNGDQENEGAPYSGAAYVFTWLRARLAPIAPINHTAGGVHLTIPVSAGQSIGVEYSESLFPGSWLDIGDFIVTGVAGDFTDNDPARMAQPSGYYRAVLR